MRLAVSGLVLAAILGIIWGNFGSLGLQAAWPILIGFVIVPLGTRPKNLGSLALGAFIGVITGLLMFAIMSAYFPFVGIAFGIAAGVAVGVLALMGAAAKKFISMPAGFAGFAALVGLYEPTWILNRAVFLTDSLNVAATVFVGLAAGMFTSFVVGRIVGVVRYETWAAPAPSSEATTQVHDRRRKVSRRMSRSDRRVAILADFKGLERRSDSSDRRARSDRRSVEDGLVVVAGTSRSLG